MGKTYQLTVKNTSSNYGDICVYQTVPNQDNNLFSLAWFSKACHPGTSVDFRWSTDYSFFWSESGVLTPGVVFDATEQKEADPDDPTMNAIGFSKMNDAYLFTPSRKHPSGGNLGIYVDGSVPYGDAAVGIGMGGQAAFATNVIANYSLTFTPHPQYWVVFGSFQEGEVMDINSCSSGYNVKFPANVYKMEVTLQDGNAWERTR